MWNQDIEKGRKSSHTVGSSVVTLGEPDEYRYDHRGLRVEDRVGRDMNTSVIWACSYSCRSARTLGTITPTSERRSEGYIKKP
jgi:hypothetical protein